MLSSFLGRGSVSCERRVVHKTMTEAAARRPAWHKQTEDQALVLSLMCISFSVAVMIGCCGRLMPAAHKQRSDLSSQRWNASSQRGNASSRAAVWTAPPPLPPVHTVVRDWLLSSSEGWCSDTLPPFAARNPANSCAVGEAGTFFVDRKGIRAWSRGAQLCLKLCATCGRCRFVSLSAYRDVQWTCSWYTTCSSLRPLQRNFSHARSGALQQAQRTTLLAPSVDNRSLERGWLRKETRRWLTASRRGYCAPTMDEGDCRAGTQGALPLPASAFQDARGFRHQRSGIAAEACVEACMTCAACRFVTLSVSRLDCRCTRHRPVYGARAPGFTACRAFASEPLA